jgi:hypothetical protein
MKFFDLERSFVPIRTDKESSLDLGRSWGHTYGGWLNWSEILNRPRVVILAEASSGKSAEFLAQAEKLGAGGKFAFFIRIEELVDQGLESALSPRDSGAFQLWRSGADDGWFFLDSVDEARLNRKSFHTALNRFAREVGSSLERAKVLISCRVSDWKGGEDRELISRLLPAWERAKTSEQSTDKSPLLDPIFSKKNHPSTRESQQQDQKPNELLVAQLAPLTTDQYRAFALHLGVSDVAAFVKGVEQNGLDAFTERPGDLIDLAEYWKAHGQFGTFAEMVEHGVNRKLSEHDAYRSDNEALTPEKARIGAERVAAALSLAKSFTLRAPGQDPDPSLAAGALDPKTILSDWSASEQNALLRLGAFAPSTYGRIRFHHRATQEYLTAQWLDRLLRANCPRELVWNLIFVTRYGVETVVPSLHPIAAWLALRHPDFLEEVIRREPLILIRHGDPGSIPIESKKTLLLVFAAKHAAAEVSDDSIEHRAIWMFSNPALAESIRDAWQANVRPEFRMDLLRLVREGAIAACADLARAVALDDTARDFLRIVAIQTLSECHDTDGLKLAAQLLTGPKKLSIKIASEFTKLLYPEYVTLDEVLALIESAPTPRKDVIEDFPFDVVEIYRACPDSASRVKFVTKLVDLCLTPPFVESYQRISNKYSLLARQLLPIAHAEVNETGNLTPPQYLVRLLMVLERAEHGGIASNLEPRLDKIVRVNPKIQRALFWSDVEEQRANSKEGQQAIRSWQIYFFGAALWALGLTDLPWLYEDLSERSEPDQRIALSAILAILKESNQLDSQIATIRKLVGDRSVLASDLEAMLTPPREDEESRRLTLRIEENARKRAEQEKEAKATWVSFRDYVQSNISQLRDPQLLSTWKAGAFRLGHLAQWLRHRAHKHEGEASKQWRLLEEGFGRAVAEAYRDGMMALWRVTKPARPKRKSESAITTKWINILAYAGIGIEAAENSDWLLNLKTKEAEIAALHGTLSEQGYPEWMDGLLGSHPQVVLPVIGKCLNLEWLSAFPGQSDFLHHFSVPTTRIPQSVQQILVSIISGKEPSQTGKLDTGLRILGKLSIDTDEARKLIRLSHQRLKKHVGNVDMSLRYLGMLLLIDPERAIVALETWLGAGDVHKAERAFGYLFDRHDPIFGEALHRATASTLEHLLRLAYKYIHPDSDAVHDGPYAPGSREHAETARHSILAALVNRPGSDAYYSLRRIAADPDYESRSIRFNELARGKAERDAEIPAWSAQEVLAFEKLHTTPAKTGHDLLRIVVGVLSDIQFHLDKGDVSSRPLLQRAKNEDEVQNWVVEQMNYRARGRFSAFREAVVGGGNKPDIVVSSTSAHCEVAVEVKHGGMDWTMKQLQRALTLQLGRDYLKPETRRHGVMIVTNHGPRSWRDPSNGKMLGFSELLVWLNSIANVTTNSGNGEIEIRCVGIDASDQALKT